MNETLLDKFAMSALIGICANSEYKDCDDSHLAWYAYRRANAMMKERKKHIELPDASADSIVWFENIHNVQPCWDNELVEVIFRDGATSKGEAGTYIWDKYDSCCDIIKYRKIKGE